MKKYVVVRTDISTLYVEAQSEEEALQIAEVTNERWDFVPGELEVEEEDRDD